jgi:LysR family transcriptional regulator, regulator for genes of the gallate degradation pathway
LSDMNLHRREVSASLHHLKLFESAARLHSVRKASEECHLSQPAVTQAIAKLEEQIGATLLERRATGTYLNEFGEIVYKRTQRLFAQIERALVELGVPNDPPAARIASRVTRSQIRSLTAIVEYGSFAHAARALKVTQTSLQRAARDLERSLRTPLYAQTAFGIVATPAGAEFARKLKLAMRELNSALDELEAAKGNIGGEIVIGAMLFAGNRVLASVVNEYALAYPNASIRVGSGNSVDMHKSLRAGDVDFVIGLLRDPPPDDLVNMPLAETPFVVAARHKHPLARKTKVTLRDLAEYEWLIGMPGSRRRAQFDRLFGQRQRPKSRLAVGSLPIIRLLLAENDYLTLLTSYEMLHEEGLATIPFGPILPAPSIGLTMRDNWLPTQLQANFIKLVKQRIA